MFSYLNLDLLTVGVAIGANILIGFSAFISNIKSATHKLFFLQSIIISLWSLVNYISYQPHNNIILSLILVRLVLFFAVPNSVIFLILMNTFPSEAIKISKKTILSLVSVTFITMVITLTPLLFKGIIINKNNAPTPIVNTGLIPFIILAVFSLPIGIFYLFRNYINAPKNQKKQFVYLIIGVVSMFLLIIPLNFIFPALLHNSRFIPYSAVFTFPFVAFTAYAIYKHKLFNIKVAGTAFLTFILAVVTFAEIIFSDTTVLILFRTGEFMMVLIFGILLLKGVLREVQQREEIAELAGELGKSNDKLEIANERLQEVDRMKTEFVSLATHQIRSPLTAIKGYISLMQEGDYGRIPKSLQEPLDIIMTSTNNLVTIVGDFLDVSRIEQGRMKYEFSNFDVEKLAEQVATEYKPNVEKKGLKFSYSAEKNKNYIIFGDMGKIKQVIGNIIDNSIKYTPQGSITVNVDAHGDKVLIEVSDTGVGIPPKTMPKLFQKFTRAENANDANILGTGLGLYVARQMIEAHHGRVWAESAGIGKGSQFFIELSTTNKAIPANADVSPKAETPVAVAK